MKVWISKYALTQGIYEAEVTTSETGWVYQPISKEFPYGASIPLKNWHANRYDAVQQAQRMRDDKIKSLEQQIAKLRALEF